MASQRTKYLGIYLVKDASSLCTANYKTLLKKIKDDLNKVRYLHGLASSILLISNSPQIDLQVPFNPQQNP